ncbi:MAG: DUF349 domain-containing protein [Schleiferiaceae bacterium]
MAEEKLNQEEETPKLPLNETGNEETTDSTSEDSQGETEVPPTEAPQDEKVETSAEANVEATPVAETKPEEEENTPSSEDDDMVDSTEAVESDEEQDEYAEEHLELPDLNELSVDQLIDEAKKWLHNVPVQRLKDPIESIRTAVLKELDEVRNAKREAFLAEGGNELDFEFIQPQREAFRALYNEFKTKRRNYYQQLEKDLSSNLAIKQDIVKQIKELPTQPGTVNEAYNTFKGLMDRWKETGPVPKLDSTELWRNYHHHVDNFYEYLRMSKELRELDFQKNLDQKKALVQEALELAKAEINTETFNALQALHKKWKEVGPVDREHREELWKEFSEATKSIHDKRHDFFKQRKEEAGERLKEKAELVEKIQNFSIDKLKSHNAWQNAIKSMDQLRNQFKSLGRINLPENDALWEKYREANKAFNKAKNDFYKELKSQQSKNLERKKALLAKVEELKESTAWKETSNELKRIQQDWKKIGYVPRSESDKIWNQFRAACNHFFDRLTEHNKELDKALEVNLAKKQELLEKFKKSEIVEDAKEAMETLKAWGAEWKEAGRVPRAAAEIEKHYNELVDSVYDKLNLSKAESQLIKFKSKVVQFFDGDDHHSLNRELDAVRKKMDEVKKEILQLETNVSMVSGGDDNPFVKEVKKQVSKLNDQLEVYKTKLAFVRDERKNREKAAAEAEAANSEDAEGSSEAAEEPAAE